MCCSRMITLVELFTCRVSIETISFIPTKISIFLFWLCWFGGRWFCCHCCACSTSSCRNSSFWCISGWWFTLNVGGPVTILEFWIKEQSIGTIFDVSFLIGTMIELFAIRMSINSINLTRTEFSWRFGCYWWRSRRGFCWL